MKNRKKIAIGLLLFIIFTICLNNSYNYVSAAEDEKVIYLTFDDGPGGQTTEKVLDILKEENVPATFFLIGDQFEGQEEVLKRIAEEGHSLGLHSMSHDKAKLYSSDDLFLKEMQEEQKLLKDITGVDSNILRFPFGCNNNSYKLKESLVNLLHENNFKIYDWNVDTTDGANHLANPSLYIKNGASDKSSVTLLMHCGYINKNSAIALPQIIKYYKDQGYTFKKIDADTPEVFHYMK